MTVIHVDTIRVPREAREKARAGLLPAIWKSAWIVKMNRHGELDVVLGGGSSHRVAAERAAAAAVAAEWF